MPRAIKVYQGAIATLLISAVLFFALAYDVLAQSTISPAGSSTVVTTRPPIVTPPDSMFDHFHVNFTEAWARLSNYMNPPITVTIASTASTSSPTSTASTGSSAPTTAATSASTSVASTATTTISTITTTRPPIVTPPNSTFDHFHLNLTEIWSRFYHSVYTTTTTTTSLTSTITSLTTTFTTTLSTSTTTIYHTTKVSLPSVNWNASSQLIVQGANTTLGTTNASGGNPPYQYQWLGSHTNSTGSFNATLGQIFCGASSNSPICIFQTVTGTTTLSPGAYYLKLQVTDQSRPHQIVNTSVIIVNVLRSRTGSSNTQQNQYH